MLFDRFKIQNNFRLALVTFTHAKNLLSRTGERQRIHVMAKVWDSMAMGLNCTLVTAPNEHQRQQFK